MFIVSSHELGPEMELGISALEPPFDYPPLLFHGAQALAGSWAAGDNNDNR